MRRKLKGFTLVECIISLLILSVMSMLFLSIYGTAVKIYKKDAVLHQKFDQQINIASLETVYSDEVQSEDRYAYVVPDMQFDIKYSGINSTTENGTCSAKSTIYEVQLDRFGNRPIDSNYDKEYEGLYNYSYYCTNYTPYPISGADNDE